MSYAIRQCEKVAYHLGGNVVTSARGVPHTVIPVGKRDASVCFFGKRKIFRIFFPYRQTPGGEQERIDCKHITEVMEQVTALREREVEMDIAFLDAQIDYHCDRLSKQPSREN